MLSFIKKIKNQKEDLKNYSKLLDKNIEFIEKLSDNEQISLFIHLKKYTKIIYSQEKKQCSFLNEYYNDFFSIYEEIIIGQDDLKISYQLMLDTINENYLDCIVCIATEDDGTNIFIKKNSQYNGIFMDIICTEEDILNNNTVYGNIYIYLLKNIGAKLNINLENEYIKMKSIDI